MKSDSPLKVKELWGMEKGRGIELRAILAPERRTAGNNKTHVSSTLEINSKNREDIFVFAGQFILTYLRYKQPSLSFLWTETSEEGKAIINIANYLTEFIFKEITIQEAFNGVKAEFDKIERRGTLLGKKIPIDEIKAILSIFPESDLWPPLPLPQGTTVILTDSFLEIQPLKLEEVIRKIVNALNPNPSSTISKDTSQRIVTRVKERYDILSAIGDAGSPLTDEKVSELIKSVFDKQELPHSSELNNALTADVYPFYNYLNMNYLEKPSWMNNATWEKEKKRDPREDLYIKTEYNKAIGYLSDLLVEKEIKTDKESAQ